MLEGGYVQWLADLFPYPEAYAAALYFMVTRLFRFEVDELPGGREYSDAWASTSCAQPSRARRRTRFASA
jgi:hypothetical protein